jgi:hypothetical protein
MKRNTTKNNIIFLFLTLFLLIKIAGLHVLSHTDSEDDIEHCIVCDIAVTHNLTPVITPNSNDFLIVNITFFDKKNIFNVYNFAVSSALTTDQLFPRPPPSLF